MRKRKTKWGVALSDACADMARKLLKRGDIKSARSWLRSAERLLAK